MENKIQLQSSAIKYSKFSTLESAVIKFNA